MRLRSFSPPLLIGLVLMAFAVWQTHRLALQYAIDAGKVRAETVLRMTVNALDGELEQYKVVPQLLADLEAIRLLIATPDDPARRSAVNIFLAERNAALTSSDIYVMRLDGETIASSNHDRAESFVGQNFSFRPYFQDALRGALLQSLA